MQCAIYRTLGEKRIFRHGKHKVLVIHKETTGFRFSLGFQRWIHVFASLMGCTLRSSLHASMVSPGGT